MKVSSWVCVAFDNWIDRRQRERMTRSIERMALKVEWFDGSQFNLTLPVQHVLATSEVDISRGEFVEALRTAVVVAEQAHR